MFNVQRSTLNVQWSDRKGGWWAEYGDRHDVWGLAAQIEGQTRYLARAARLLTRRTRPSAGRTVQAGCGGQMWGQTRNLSKRTFGPVDLTKRGSGGRGGLGAQIWGQT